MFRTRLGRSSISIPAVGPDYEETVGAMNRRRAGYDRTAPGDPARAARIILDAVDLDEPPLRLLLGSDAVNLAEGRPVPTPPRPARWAEVSRSTDFPLGG